MYAHHCCQLLTTAQNRATNKLAPAQVNVDHVVDYQKQGALVNFIPNWDAKHSATGSTRTREDS